MIAQNTLRHRGSFLRPNLVHGQGVVVFPGADIIGPSLLLPVQHIFAKLIPVYEQLQHSDILHRSVGPRGVLTANDMGMSYPTDVHLEGDMENAMPAGVMSVC